MNSQLQYVFVSHTQDERPFARDLVSALGDRGVQALLGEDVVEPGEQFEKAFAEALTQARAYVLLISEGALRLWWMQFEVGAAIGSRKPLLLVDLSKRGRIQLPPDLQGFAQIKTPDRDADDVADRIVEYITAPSAE